MPTHRTALAAVRNETGADIAAVSLVHKYSDDYKNDKAWGLLKNGQTSDNMLADYHTGALTTGRDWWMVSWFSKDMKTQYCTDPENFRGVIDALESVGPEAMSRAAGALAVAAESPEAEEAAAAVGKAVGSKLCNSESTSGFKQHILRDEDEGKVLTITLGTNEHVTIQSPSGKSETKYTHRGTGH